MKPTILLVDDEYDLVTIYVEAATIHFPNHTTVGVTGVEEALQIVEGLKEQDLALVCADESLGDSQSGLELITRIRERFPNLPAMLYTGRATQQIADAAASHNISVFWKPMPLRSWLAEVGNRLEPSPKER